MSATKILAIGIATIALGASGSPGASATQPSTPQNPRPITATATADEVRLVNTSTDSRLLIIRVSSQPGEAPTLSEVAGEARIPTRSSDVILAFRLSAGYMVSATGDITDCKIAECPIPPPCPVAKCPWARNLTFVKPQTPKLP